MILINKVPNHQKHKKIILDKISEFSQHHNLQLTHQQLSLKKGERTKGTKSDYFVPKEEHRGYLDYFYSDVIPSSLEKVGKDLGLWPFEIKIHNGWFQQYTDGGEHNWHNHAD